MILKFTPHYWSGATYKAHEGDTINYYEAENDLSAMAAGIYEAALDMDFGDYTETRDEEINRLSAALASLDHDGILFQALQRIYG